MARIFWFYNSFIIINLIEPCQFTSGPKLFYCINNGMTLGFRRALVGVLGILTQATLFLLLSAFGITALIAASPTAFAAAKLLGAAFLIYLGIRGWITAKKPVRVDERPATSIYFRAFAIATTLRKNGSSAVSKR